MISVYDKDTDFKSFSIPQGKKRWKKNLTQVCPWNFLQVFHFKLVANNPRMGADVIQFHKTNVFRGLRLEEIVFIPSVSLD